MNQRYDDNGMWKIVRLWPIILSFGLGVGALFLMKHNLQANTIKLDECEQQVQKNKMEIEIMKVHIKRIPAIEKDVKELLRRVPVNRASRLDFRYPRTTDH